jgi:[acyl-carrier-protein] S-malonyltransferase
MVSYLFAGQSSQYVGMGKDLYEAIPEAKAVFDKADQVLGFPLSKLCFQGPLEELTRTHNCQPAILTATIAAYEAYKQQAGSRLKAPGYVAGLSLGEYSALVAAGALSFADAVYLVRRRGEFMEEEAKARPGKMLSVIGWDLEKVKKLCQLAHTEIANINCPGQTVISGAPQDIEKARELAISQGAKMTVVLEVSGAFHSSFMQEATRKLAQVLEKIKIQKPYIPVVSNVTAKPTVDPQDIRDNLIKQVAASVLWEDSMKFIISQGIMNFIEFGPGRVLKGLMRRIDATAQVINIEKKEDILNAVGSM